MYATNTYYIKMMYIALNITFNYSDITKNSFKFSNICNIHYA